MKIHLISIIAIFLGSCDLIQQENASHANKLMSDSINNKSNSLLEIKNNSLEDTFSINEAFLPIENFVITKDKQHYKIQEYDFKAYWSEHFNYSENLKRYVGGITKLEISKNNKLIQVLDTIPDENAIGEIRVTTSDFNFDGLIDFTLPLGTCGKSCYDKYYLFNSIENKFIYVNTWDYMRIYCIKIKENLIKTVAENRCCQADYTIYKVDGLKLTEVKKIHSGK